VTGKEVGTVKRLLVNFKVGFTGSYGTIGLQRISCSYMLCNLNVVIL